MTEAKPCLPGCVPIGYNDWDHAVACLDCGKILFKIKMPKPAAAEAAKAEQSCDRCGATVECAVCNPDPAPTPDHIFCGHGDAPADICDLRECDLPLSQHPLSRAGEPASAPATCKCGHSKISHSMYEDLDECRFCECDLFDLLKAGETPEPVLNRDELIARIESDAKVIAAMASEVSRLNLDLGGQIVALRAEVERLRAENRRVWNECERLAKLTGGPGMTLNSPNGDK